MRGAFRRPFLMAASLLAFSAPIALLSQSGWRYVPDKVGRWRNSCTTHCKGK
jgi:hypothetical protein